jgi:hypothetical protein
MGCSKGSGNIAPKKVENIKTYSYDRDFAIITSGY